VSDWTRGYSTDITYTAGYYPSLNPALHCFALLTAGWRPPTLDRDFTYAELGCGHGTSVLIHAAAAAPARFFANDFMPAHIATVEMHAREAGLTTLALSDAPFAAYADAALPPLDAVVLHGVWSWVDETSRDDLLRFLRRHLKPGGYVYVSYNALPGWAPILPLRELLRGGEGDDSGQRARAGVAFAERLYDADARWFAGNEPARIMLERLRRLPGNYLAHEYMNDAWRLLYHHDVVRELQAAQMTFATSAALRDKLDDLLLTEEQQALLDEIPAGPRRELARDFCLNPLLRRDLFLRDGVRLHATEQARRLNETSFVLLVPRSRVELRLAGPIGTVTLPHEVHAPILDLLRDGPCSLAAIRARLGLQEDLATTVRTLELLVGAELIAPCLPTAGLAARRETTTRLNDHVLQGALAESGLDVLASPVTGGGVRLDRVERLFLLGVRRNAPDLAAFAWRILQGKAATANDPPPLVLRDGGQRFLSEMLPLLQQLAIA
jgi:SAM-dependent methyltransferase